MRKHSTRAQPLRAHPLSPVQWRHYHMYHVSWNLCDPAPPPPSPGPAPPRAYPPEREEGGCGLSGAGGVGSAV